MTDNKAIEWWEDLYAKYRGTELCVLYFEALRKGLQKGSITAEDLHGISVVNPNIRGAVMRGLRRSGLFEKEAIAFGSTEASHGHTMFRWRLTDHVAAKTILYRCAGFVTNRKEESNGQICFC